ncbi:MAG TPA: hypothetical protein VFK41_06520 [Nocardioidaceae bacterium]|nr:hypothetical protein [Nocardioidaceae bacterium]
MRDVDDFDEPTPPQRFTGTSTERDESMLHWRDARDLELAELAQRRWEEGR